MKSNEYPAFAKASAGKRGFIRNIILIVGALVVLKYVFHFDLITFLSPEKLKVALNWLQDRIWAPAYQFFKNLAG